MQRSRCAQRPSSRPFLPRLAGDDTGLPEKKDADNLTMFHLVFALARDAHSSVIKMCKQIAEEARAIRPPSLLIF